MGIPFLTAQWTGLVVVNYEIPPETLEPLVPRATKLDFYEGKTFVSLVAFRFLRNKLFGVFPTYPSYSFEEINLRFYLRAPGPDGERKGVAFVKEFVPSRFIAWTARTLYGEPYEAVPTFHDANGFDSSAGGLISYGFQHNGQGYGISARTKGPLMSLKPETPEHFILEHYWGYTARSNGTTSEYAVKHPAWKLWEVDSLNITENCRSLYGPRFSTALSAKPHSAFVAQGSDVSVHIGRTMRAPQ